MVYEVANALRYHPRAGMDRLAEHIGDLFALDIGFDPTSETSMIAAIHSAFRLVLSIYDASYISLAERLDTILNTAHECPLPAPPSRRPHFGSTLASEWPTMFLPGHFC